MAAGDALFAGAHNISNDGTVDFKAASSGEAVAHTIAMEQSKQWELHVTNDGTNFIKSETYAYGGTLTGISIEVSDTKYIRMINKSGGSAGILVTGRVTK